MAAPVPSRFRLPNAAETRIGEPVIGRTLVSMAGACNHLTGLHLRGFNPTSVYMNEALAVANASDVGYYLDEPTKYESHRIPYYVPLGVDLLHVVAWCMSYQSGGTNTPEVAVKIVDSTGADVDKGARWTRADGSLPGDEIGSAQGWRLPPFMIESAQFSVANPLAAETGPRWLSCGAEEGNIVVIKVDTQRCRLASLYLLPVPPVTL